MYEYPGVAQGGGMVRLGIDWYIMRTLETLSNKTGSRGRGGQLLKFSQPRFHLNENLPVTAASSRPRRLASSLLITRWQGYQDLCWNRFQLVPIEFKSGSTYVKHTINSNRGEKPAIGQFLREASLDWSMTGIQNVRKWRQFVLVYCGQKNANKIMPDF